MQYIVVICLLLLTACASTGHLERTFKFEEDNNDGIIALSVECYGWVRKVALHYRRQNSNDNALVGSKNSSIVGKILGYVHIPQKYAPQINEFNKNFIIPYINFHRPCYFAEIKTDQKSKVKKVYPYRKVMTPYEKLKSLPDAKRYLKAQVTFEGLDKQMMMSDLQAANMLRDARKKLFEKIFPKESIDNA